MDQKRLDAIRAIVENPPDRLKSDRDAALAATVPELLDYASRMKADMMSIRKLIAGLAGKELSQTRVAVAHFKIYNLAAQHADEAET